MQRWPWQTGARWLAALGGASLLCVAPYAAALHEVTGVWTLTHKKSVAGMVLGEVAPTPGAPVPEAPPGSTAAPVPSPSRSSSAADPQAPQPGPAAGAPAPAAAPPAWLHALYLSAPVTVDASWLAPEYLDQDGLRVALSASRTERAIEALRMLARHARSSLRYGVVVLLGFGLWAAWGRPTGRGVYIAAVAGLYLLVLYGLTLTSGYVSRRHTLPPLLPLFGYAGLGGLVIGAWLAQRLHAPARAGLAGALVIAAFAAGDLATQIEPKRVDELAMRRAAEWLHEHAPEPGPVAAPRQRFGYYARMPYVPLAGVAEDSLARYLSGTHARYVLLEDAGDMAALRRAEGSGVRVLHQVEVGGVQAFVVELPRWAQGPPGEASGTPAEP
jgi:hypothetical protein